MSKKDENFASLFLSRYPDRAGVVSYVREAIGKKDVMTSDLTRVNLSKICDTINEGVVAGTARTYFSLIKAFINLYADEYDIPCTDTKLLHAKRVPSQNVYLTETEIESLEGYLDILERKSTKKCQDKCEIDVLHAFLAECYCGARGCDVKNFTEENMQDGYLNYVSKKTHVLSQLPIHRHLRRHLSHKGDKHKEAVVNRTIKRICQVCGITEIKTLYYRGKLQTLPKYEFVGFHTARRSFATNLALRNVPLSVICQMMNHGQNLLMTQRYIVTDVKSFNSDTLAFFH